MLINKLQETNNIFYYILLLYSMMITENEAYAILIAIVYCKIVVSNPGESFQDAVMLFRIVIYSYAGLQSGFMN